MVHLLFHARIVSFCPIGFCTASQVFKLSSDMSNGDPWVETTLRSFPRVDFDTEEASQQLSEYTFRFWACSRHDGRWRCPDIDCRDLFDEHLLRAARISGKHDGRHIAIQRAIQDLSLVRENNDRPDDARHMPWQQWCDALVSILKGTGRRDIVWRCRQGRHR